MVKLPFWSPDTPAPAITRPMIRVIEFLETAHTREPTSKIAKNIIYTHYEKMTPVKILQSSSGVDLILPFCSLMHTFDRSKVASPHLRLVSTGVGSGFLCGRDVDIELTWQVDKQIHTIPYLLGNEIALLLQVLPVVCRHVSLTS